MTNTSDTQADAKNGSTLSEPSRPIAHRLALEIDYAYYEAYLKNADMTPEQKRELLDCLWNIIVGFVDLGFGVHPVQQVLGDEPNPSHEKAGDRMIFPARLLLGETTPVVECEGSITHKIENKDDGVSSPSQGGSPA